MRIVINSDSDIKPGMVFSSSYWTESGKIARTIRVLEKYVSHRKIRSKKLPKVSGDGTYVMKYPRITFLICDSESEHGNFIIDGYRLVGMTAGWDCKLTIEGFEL